MNRYFSSFMATLLIYSLLFATFLYSFNIEKNISSQPKQNLDNIRFTVIEKRKPQEVKKTVEKKVIEKKTIVKKEPPVKQEPKKIIKKDPVKKIVKKEAPKKIKPKKQLVKKEEPKPVKKTVEKKIVKKEPQKKEPKQEKIVKQQIKQQKKIVKKVDNSIEENLIKAKKDNYFKFIKEAIAKNKEYPRIAVRRGIQGDVKIKFTISKNGELLKYDIINGHRLFKKSIIKALGKTFPLKPPKDIFLSNIDLSLTIAYRLN